MIRLRPFSNGGHGFFPLLVSRVHLPRKTSEMGLLKGLVIHDPFHASDPIFTQNIQLQLALTLWFSSFLIFDDICYFLHILRSTAILWLSAPFSADLKSTKRQGLFRQQTLHRNPVPREVGRFLCRSGSWKNRSGRPLMGLMHPVFCSSCGKFPILDLFFVTSNVVIH